MNPSEEEIEDIIDESDKDGSGSMDFLVSQKNMQIVVQEKKRKEILLKLLAPSTFFLWKLVDQTQPAYFIIVDILSYLML